MKIKCRCNKVFSEEYKFDRHLILNTCDAIYQPSEVKTQLDIYRLIRVEYNEIIIADANTVYSKITGYSDDSNVVNIKFSLPQL